MSTQTTATVFEIELPSTKIISFRTPTYKDRQIATRRWRQQQSEVGWALEELVGFSMLELVDGQPLHEGIDVLEQVEHWSMKDVSYFLEIFFLIAFTDDTDKQRAQTQAKALLEGKSVVKSAASRITSAPTMGITA
jgi:hypothetical protein